MMAPIAGKELKLYLAFNDNAIGIVLAQDDQNGQEKPIYYASRILKEAEARYTKAETNFLALIYFFICSPKVKTLYAGAQDKVGCGG